ncbi:MAG: peptidoglycan DD-metalloendopeptidase family protein [Desulfobacter sp.]|nr:MAG: peptidoglycan DD-metalloendopeptidase family protein [Desulfobacter sp.]
MLFIPEANFKIGKPFLCAWLLAWLALVPAAASGAEVLYQGTVTAHKLNIRERPARGSAVVLVLDKGEEVEVLEARGGIGGWLLVRYHGEEGYVRNRPQYIALVQSEPAQAAPRTVTAKVLKPKPPKDAPHSEEIKAKPADPAPEAARARKKAIKQQIEEEARKVASFSEKEVEILDGLNAIDFALNQARVRSVDLRRETRALTLEIDRIQGSLSTLAKAMDKNQAYAGRRLNALYRMHMMGSLEMAGPPASLFDFFIKQKSLKKVVASDFSLLEKQAGDLRELGRLEDDLSRQIASRTALEEELALQIRIREKESRKKSAILQEIRQKKKLSQAAIASLKSSAKALDQALDRMGMRGSPALDNTSFVRQKGRLAAPVPGKIVSRYGKARKGDYNSFTFQSGIDIRVERGEPVRSVFKGEVMFARWLKGYGNLVIINHGDNYYTLYAHVEEVFKKKGESVGTGEVIATAGDTGSIKGLCLHFEVRHHGKPVNPMTWLKKGA